MRQLRPLAVCVFLCGSLALRGQTPPKTHLKVGDLAPNFTLPATTGKPISLSDYRDKKAVVLAFFPAAFTGG